MLMAERKTVDTPRQDGSAPGFDRRKTPEPIPTEQLVSELLQPIHSRLADDSEDSPEDERRARRSIDEFLQEIATGLTEFVAGRAKQELLPQLEAWHQRRDDERSAHRTEMTGVLELMGKALKGIQGGDEVFHDGLDANLDRLRNAADEVQIRTVSRRIETLIDATLAHATKEREARERRIHSLSESIRGLHEELAEVRVQLAEDPLTGLYNRGSFDERLEVELNKARLAPYQFALIMIDLDHFKLVNDEHLHVGGDRVLIACAKAIQEVVLRKSDLCARYGGEEMVVILTDCNADDAARVAEVIRERIEALEVVLSTGTVRPTASLGVTCFVEGDRAERVISRADRALYKAKRSGRNQVQVAAQHTRRRSTPTRGRRRRRSTS